MAQRPPHLLPGQSPARRAQLLNSTPLDSWQDEIARGGIFSADKLAALFLVLGLVFTQLTIVATPIARAAGGTITFQQGSDGYSGVIDTFVSIDSASTNHSASPALQAESQDQTLIRFEGIIGDGAGQIPPGAEITSASVTLTNSSNTTTSGATLSMHRMRTNWSDSSTWNSLDAGVQTDDVEASTTVAASTSSNLTTSNAAVTIPGLEASVQAWVDGEPNLGWVFLLNSADGWDAHSSETGTVGNRPLLTVTYTSTPDTVAINSTGDAGDNNPGDGVCDTGGTVGSNPECTLRAAIQEANASAIVDTIEFDIPQTDGGYSASPSDSPFSRAASFPRSAPR